MKEDNRIYNLLQIISENLNTVVQNQARIFAELEAIRQRIEKE